METFGKGKSMAKPSDSRALLHSRVGSGYSKPVVSYEKEDSHDADSEAENDCSHRYRDQTD